MNGENEHKKNNYEKMKCIWMSSGVIDYKLCDNQFNCEKCHFDKAMRNLIDKDESGDGITSPIDLISDKLEHLKYDERLMYLKNSLVAKFICKNTFYLGINPILISFLDSTSSLIMYEYGDNIKSGQKLMGIYGSWGKLDFTAPVDLLLYDKVCSSNEIPLNSSWVAIIGCDSSEINNWVISKSQWADMYLKAVDIILEIKKNMLKDCGTMFDGGSQVLSLHQIVGSNNYLSILKSVSE